MIDALNPYIYYITLPCVIWLFFTVIVFLLWVLGTDAYDKLNVGSENDDDTIKYFSVMGGICAFNIVICLIFSFNNPLNLILNAFLLFCYVFMGGAIFIDLCTSVRQYCRNKRGKS